MNNIIVPVTVLTAQHLIDKIRRARKLIDCVRAVVDFKVRCARVRPLYLPHYQVRSISKPKPASPDNIFKVRTLEDMLTELPRPSQRVLQPCEAHPRFIRSTVNFAFQWAINQTLEMVQM